jgi:uncharacterized protein YceK
MQVTTSGNKRMVILSLLALVLTIGVYGCATIMHGTSQDIGITSHPTGARVTIDNQEFGTTPVVAKLSRKDNHTIHMELPGYQPDDATVTRSTSGWVWGNIVFGGLIGLAVDAISGGLYKLTPEEVTGDLVATGQGELDGADIIIAVVLQPDPSWEKIGKLQPLTE